jgi:very-short-patch-repair endonuclease
MSVTIKELTASRQIQERIKNPFDRNDSNAENQLAFQLKAAKAPLFERQFKIILGRRFKADFYFPVARLIVEVDGGGWIHGRHSRGAGMERDCEKSALIAAMPARLLRVTPKHVEDGRALNWILKALNA